MQLDREDEDLRGTLTVLVAELGFAPSTELLAQRAALATAEVERRLHRLAEANALLLHPRSARPWVVHPFALAPGSCWVRTPEKGYWANCLYCGLGIAAALKRDATITTRLGGEEETARYEVRDGAIAPTGHLFHLSTPPARWWDNVVFACSTFQTFRTEQDIDQWCVDHALPRGAVMTVPQLWQFAQDWYGGYIGTPWRKRTVGEVVELFRRHGLVGPFWSFD
jgi:hypothetical protein